MTDAQLERKFLSMARRALDEERSHRLLKTCREMEHLQNPLEVFRLGTL